MAKGRKTGGRQKGSLNKKPRISLLEKFEELNFDLPAAIIVAFGNQISAIQTQPEYMQADSYAKLMEMYLRLLRFLYPEKKAEEVSVAGFVATHNSDRLSKDDILNLVKVTRGIGDD